MPAADVALVREAFERFNREGPPSMRETFHAEAVSVPFPEWPDQSVYEGGDGAAKLGEQWTELFDGYQWDIQHAFEAGDAVVVLAIHSGVARGSGMETRSKVGAVFSEFRDGRVARVHYFLTWRETLDHAGVDEGAIPENDG